MNAGPGGISISHEAGIENPGHWYASAKVVCLSLAYATEPVPIKIFLSLVHSLLVLERVGGGCVQTSGADSLVMV